MVPAATFCKAGIPERVIADSEFPAEVVVPPQVISLPISVKPPEPISYCQMPVVGPVAERRTL